MADDTLLILFWTALAVVFGIYVLWKYLQPRNANQQRIAASQASEDVKKARLKYFTGNEEGGSNSADLLVAAAASYDSNIKHETSLEGEKIKEERDSEKSVDTSAFEPSVQYTKLIEGPKLATSQVVENSGFDAETGAPCCRPLKTLEELLSWRQGFDFFNVATVPLTEKNRTVEKRPRTLVCHDMKGGYIEDRSVQTDIQIVVIVDLILGP